MLGVTSVLAGFTLGSRERQQRRGRGPERHDKQRDRGTNQHQLPVHDGFARQSNEKSWKAAPGLSASFQLHFAEREIPVNDS
jgi:hypothetical protein